MSKIVNAWSQIAPPPPVKPVALPPIPGLNTADGEPAKLFARKITAGNLDEFQVSMRDKTGQSTAESVRWSSIKFLAVTLVDPQGNPLFEDSKDAIEAMREFDGAVTEQLYAEVVKAINASVDEQAVASAEKNSARTPSGSSPGTSASSSE